MINLIKVSATASTNTLLKEMVRTKSISEASCLWTTNQTHGKGQMGNVWHAQVGLNLTFSIYIPNCKLSQKQPQHLNLISALSITETLKQLKIPELSIKWPNDIMSANKKIGGILIENMYQKNFWAGSIIGIGLNVNQEKLEHLPQANSLKNILKKNISLENLLHDLLYTFEKNWDTYQPKDYNQWKTTYENQLFKRNKVATFQDNLTLNYFNGIIQGITATGELQIKQDNDQLKCYKLKEIKLLY